MTAGRVGRWVLAFHLILTASIGLSLALPGQVAVATPVIAYGLTNHALGQAQLETYDYSEFYKVTNLRSNGLDGVSVILGEPDSGVFLEPTTTYLQDGNFMIAKAYGQLDGSNDTLLATVQGGRASDTIYPLTLDFSPLAPQSVTYQVFWNGKLQREFTRGSPIVVINWGYSYYPTVNPISRRSDGAWGTSLVMSSAVNFVFPEALGSAYGDQLFIRLNNPGRVPGNVTRVDVFGGGNLYDFSFIDIGLGVFGRAHQALYRATLQAGPSRLRIDNLSNTNFLPGVLIAIERLAALELQCEPLSLLHSNAFLQLTAVGTAGGSAYSTLGDFSVSNRNGCLSVHFNQESFDELRLAVLTNGAVVYVTNVTDSVCVPTNAVIQSVTAHGKTVQDLPGYHVRFTEAVPITVFSNAPPVTGDEIRLLVPYPARMEYLQNLYVAGQNVGPIIITNEVATPQDPPPKMQITRSGQNVILTWPDPNTLFSLSYADYGGPDGPYFGATNQIAFSDPYATATIPIVRTNRFTYFKLYSYPPY